MIRRAVQKGELTRMAPGLYRLPAAPDHATLALRTALAHAGPDAALSHVTAAGLWGWAPSGASGPVHVSVPHGVTRRALPGVVIHQSRRLEPFPCQGWPVTEPRRTLIDLAGMPDPRPFRFAAAQAVSEGTLDLASLQDATGVGGSVRGIWRRVGEEVAAGAASGGEALYWRLLVESTLPLPELNVPIVTPSATFRVDALWRDLWLITEIDGRAFHTRQGDFERDALRQNALHSLGFVVIRFPVARVQQDPHGVLDETEQLLNARAVALGVRVKWRRRTRRH